jgi:hypothetical protein
MQGSAEGEAMGRASSVIGVLEARGIVLTPEARAHILACTDLDVLDDWVRRAVTVEHAEELIGA